MEPVSKPSIILQEYHLKTPAGTEIQSADDKNSLRPCWNRKLTYRSKEVEYKRCRNWYHPKCGKVFDDVYASITAMFLYCEKCCRANNNEKFAPQVKLSSSMWMTFLEQSMMSQLVFSMPPILFTQNFSSLQRILTQRAICRSWI